MKILLYAECVGVRSSRKIARRLEDDEAFLDRRGIDAYIPPGKKKQGGPIEPAPKGRISANPSCQDQMRRKLRTKRGIKIYSRRKTIVELVFGQIKTVQGIREFLLRGLWKAQAEWDIASTVHNTLQLFRSGRFVRAPIMLPTQPITPPGTGLGTTPVGVELSKSFRPSWPGNQLTLTD